MRTDDLGDPRRLRTGRPYDRHDRRRYVAVIPPYSIVLQPFRCYAFAENTVNAPTTVVEQMLALANRCQGTGPVYFEIRTYDLPAGAPFFVLKV